MNYSNGYWEDVSQIIMNIPNIERLQNKTIAISGATGMICSAVVDIISYLNRYLDYHCQLVLIGRSQEKMDKRFKDVLHSEAYSFVPFDSLLSKKIDLKTDFIIHGAGISNPKLYSSNPVETLLGNVLGVNSMLEIVCKNLGSRLLFISSSEVYGNIEKKEGKLFCEQDYGYVDILNPRSCYPNGKRASETLCSSYAQEYGIDVVIVRPGHIYGPSISEEDTRASADFTRKVAAREDIVMKSKGNQLRSYCYTLDCATAILTVLLNGESGNAYNISNRNSIVSIREVAEEMALVGNVSIRYEIPTKEEIRGYNLMTSSALDSTKLENLGWKADYSLKMGVKKTLLYY